MRNDLGSKFVDKPLNAEFPKMISPIIRTCDARDNNVTHLCSTHTHTHNIIQRDVIYIRILFTYFCWTDVAESSFVLILLFFSRSIRLSTSFSVSFLNGKAFSYRPNLQQVQQELPIQKWSAPERLTNTTASSSNVVSSL